MPDQTARLHPNPNASLAEADGMPAPQRGWAYATVIIGIVLAVMDSTVANVALPTIARDLHVSAAGSIAIVNAYQITIVVLLLPLAALGEIYGYRRVYFGGLAVFTVASLACSLARSIDTLAAARILQGVGAAGLMSVNAALLRAIFPHRLLGRAIGWNAMVVATSATVGPSFTSVVLGVASWPWLFAVNVPLGLAALALAGRLPHTHRAHRRFDWISVILTAAPIGLFVNAIGSFGHGHHPAHAAVELGIGAVAAVLAWRRQLHAAAPLLPVDLLRIPVFALSIGTSICSFTAQMLALVALPFLMELGFGIRPTVVGFLIMPWPLATAVAAPAAARLMERVAPALLGLLGLAGLAAGLALLASLPPHPAAWTVVWRMALCGAGFGIFQTPNNRLLITAAPKSRSGAASGMLGTARLLGQATGAALVALLLSHLPEGGARLSLWLGAGFAAGAAVFSSLRLPFHRPQH